MMLYTNADREQARRLETKVDILLNGLALKAQYDRIEKRLDEITNSGMTEAEESALTTALGKKADKLDAIASPPNGT